MKPVINIVPPSVETVPAPRPAPQYRCAFTCTATPEEQAKAAQQLVRWLSGLL